MSKRPNLSLQLDAGRLRLRMKHCARVADLERFGQPIKRITTALVILVGLSGIAKGAVPDASEFTRLRMEYAEAPDALYSWAADKERVAALETFKHDKPQFVDLAIGWLKRCPIDGRVRIMLASALSELGRSDETISHRYIYYGLLNSIMAEADGSSKEKAFRVVSVDEV